MKTLTIIREKSESNREFKTRLNKISSENKDCQIIISTGKQISENKSKAFDKMVEMANDETPLTREQKEALEEKSRKAAMIALELI